ncbi:MAG: glycosyltransferase family 4 protein [Promicromonosporaceae bacterium]|nr:glycosyltransferase family 4 protein [Promicromonosporaceae bacterium]
MKVIVASTSLPHVRGGDRLIVRWTAEALRERGHRVEEFLIPFPTKPRETLSALVGLRALPFADYGDLLVAIRWPAHLLRHPNKVAWFIHHNRLFFDLWDSPHRPVKDEVEALEYRRIYTEVDNLGFRECQRIFTNSLIVRDRIRRFNGFEATPLFPPLGDDVSRFYTEGYGDFIFYPSRVTPIKRQLLAVEAMRFVRSGVRLVIAGKPEAPLYETSLRAFVAEHGLEDRVELRFGWLSEAEKVDLLARCLAVVYLPVDEDSYGYPSLEASHSAKAVITVSDAGGALEFVENGVSGFVTDPDPVELALAFDTLFEDRTLAECLGAASATRRAELGINWDHVAAELTGYGLPRTRGRVSAMSNGRRHAKRDGGSVPQ